MENLKPFVWSNLSTAAHEAQVAFLNEVEKGEAAIAVTLGDRDHQAQVGLNELVLGLLPLAYQATVTRQVAARQQRVGRPFSALGQLVRRNTGGGLVADLDGLRNLHLERRVEQRDPTDLLEIGVDRVLRASR